MATISMALNYNNKLILREDDDLTDEQAERLHEFLLALEAEPQENEG